jgi:hypothetical protein
VLQEVADVQGSDRTKWLGCEKDARLAGHPAIVLACVGSVLLVLKPSVKACYHFQFPIDIVADRRLILRQTSFQPDSWQAHFGLQTGGRDMLLSSFVSWRSEKTTFYHTYVSQATPRCQVTTRAVPSIRHYSRRSGSAPPPLEPILHIIKAQNVRLKDCKEKTHTFSNRELSPSREEVLTADHCRENITIHGTTRLSTPQRRSEMAVAYFEERLRAISSDIHAFETEYCEGRLTQGEFLEIYRSLTQAKREVQVALDTIASVR